MRVLYLTIALIVALIIAGTIAYFGYRYFLDPKGIDVSSSNICIQNESNQMLVFTAEANSGAQMVAVLGRGEELCAPSPVVNDFGTVAVFESEDAVEGCSRNAIAGETQILEAFASFDGCKWR